ncbi:MAG: RagB/SusD family nutrient uptake outer membrane protein [Bacteroidales bacterium]|nr:RagB/SusD family nutrient uptake outer membrane protein [Bacteroidales bacterium]
MKRIISYTLALALITLGACQKEFTERESLDSTTVDNYYNTADEVRAGTSTLYSGLPWHGFLSRAMDDIGDVMAGNAFSYPSNGDYAAFVNFTLSSTNALVADSWKSFYKVAGWSGSLLQAFEMKKSLGGDASFLDPAIAECHYMRGVVYFYLARVWGDVPIVDDPGAIALSGDYDIPRYLKADVFRYALEELKLAEAGLPTSDVSGRLTTWAAKAMMAKLYLYLQDYTNAATKAQEVITSGYYDLVSKEDYQSMFNSSAWNNNIESIFAIQHQLAQNPWGTGNQLQCDRGPSNLQTDVSNMWELFLPSLDFKDAFEPGDIRRPATIMEHGWSMPAWKPQGGDADYNAFMANGYVYDTAQPAGKGGQFNGTRSNIAKYVVGPGAKYGGEEVIGMNTGQNFMVQRYADVLLIYAEAILGNNASTSDAQALNTFNRVRLRAGLQPKASITKEDILQERRVEFAFEGDYWYDIQRQGFAKAKQIIEAQNRGQMGTPVYVTFTEQYMYLPIPASEITQDPALAGPPVPYYQ